MYPAGGWPAPTGEIVIRKTITSGYAKPSTETGGTGYWTRWYLLGLPIYSKFVTRVIAESNPTLVK